MVKKSETSDANYDYLLERDIAGTWQLQVQLS